MIISALPYSVLISAIPFFVIISAVYQNESNFCIKVIKDLSFKTNRIIQQRFAVISIFMSTINFNNQGLTAEKNSNVGENSDTLNEQDFSGGCNVMISQPKLRHSATGNASTQMIFVILLLRQLFKFSTGVKKKSPKFIFFYKHLHYPLN